MGSKTKLWLGVGTYLIVSTLSGLAAAQAEWTAVETAETPTDRQPIDLAQAVTEADLCRRGPGGEGGEGSVVAPAPATLAVGVDATALNQAVEQYEAYVQAQAEDLVQRVQEFTNTIIAGDLEAAKTLYPTSRIPWERIEPVAERFAAFDTSIDARVDDFQGETDPEFTGFHRIELGLFQNNSTDGLKPFADRWAIVAKKMNPTTPATPTVFRFPSMLIFVWRIPAPARPPTAEFCGKASTTRVDLTKPVSSIWGCYSSVISAIWNRALKQCRTVSTVNPWKNISNLSASFMA